MTDGQSDVETDPALEELISELRSLVNQAGAKVDEKKAETDLSNVDTSQMALAEAQGMRQAFQQVHRLAISKRQPGGDSNE